MHNSSWICNDTKNIPRYTLNISYQDYRAHRDNA